MNINKIKYTELENLAANTARNIYNAISGTGPLKLYGIPRGGVPAALMIKYYNFNFALLTENPEEADLFIDDIIDSGRTREKYKAQYPNKPFFALIDKLNPHNKYKGWIVFPWETDFEGSTNDIIIRQLQAIGENPNREGLQDTPKRVIKAWHDWFDGYGKKPEDIFKTFEDGCENYDQMIIVKDIPFYSHCEHHIAPFFGNVTIAYIPQNIMVGLSKLSRLVDIYARRLQVQERLTTQIVKTLNRHLKPKGCGCVIRARHLCMESRGISKQGHTTVTSAVEGVFKDVPEARAEFMSLLK